jgi:alpha-L-fucosidase
MNILKLMIFASLGSISMSVASQVDNLPVYPGKYKPTDESLKTYKYPEWFRDAKFGIWSHWGPQAVPRQGDWYARGMYEGPYYDCNSGKYNKGNPQYAWHLEHYGHPSEFGYKDIIPLWKAEKWNPEELMKLYKRVGAKYFVSMGVHHDNFFLWNSRLHRWNSVNMGPKKDVVGLWREAAKKEGLYFGVSEHLGASYLWFQSSHMADQLGEKAGVGYDGQNPEYHELYHERTTAGMNDWYTLNPRQKRMWYDRMQELIDNYRPDLLYSDGALPFGDTGRCLVAHYYNQDAGQKKPQGVVYCCKEASGGRWVDDYERGSAEGIREFPWQTDTSIGDWFYRTGQEYMEGREVIQMLIDIVSKNGNLLLNVVQTPEGDLEPDMVEILETIAAWMEVHGEAIYGTRPWVIYGEGPSMENQEKSKYVGVKDVRKYLPGDFRFTQKGKKVYAFCMEVPEGDISIKALGLKARTGKKVGSVKLLGCKEKLQWRQTDEELVIRRPGEMPKFETVVFEVNL